MLRGPTFIRLRLCLGRTVMRPALGASLLLHAAALGGVWWWCAEHPPATPGTPGPGGLRMSHEAVTPEEPERSPPIFDLPLPDLEMAEPEETPPVIAEPLLEPEAVFEEADASPAPPPPTFDEVPLRLAPGPRPLPAPPPLPKPPVRITPRPSPRATPPPRPRPAPPPVAPAPAPAPLRVVYAPNPRGYYPASAERRGIQGTALVRILVDVRGRVVDAVLERSTGFDALDRAAVELARAYRFNAGTGWRRTRLPVTFRIRGGS